MVGNLPATAGDSRGAGSIPGSGRSSGRRSGDPLQYSCLRNPMDGGAWRAVVRGVAKSPTQLIKHALLSLSVMLSLFMCLLWTLVYPQTSNWRFLPIFLNCSSLS